MQVDLGHGGELCRENSFLLQNTFVTRRLWHFPHTEVLGGTVDAHS